MIKDQRLYISERYRNQGIRLKEDGDHVVELWEGENRIARFSQTSPNTPIDLENTLKEIEAGKYAN